MMPLSVRLKHTVKSMRDEAISLEDAAKHLNASVDEIIISVSESDDLKIIAGAIIAKRDKTSIWTAIGAVGVLITFLMFLPAMMG